MKYVFENGGITWYNGYCPFCATRNQLHEMNRNKQGNFACTTCLIQIYPDENLNKAVILNLPSKLESIIYPVLSSGYYLKSNKRTFVLCPQKTIEHPYHLSDKFTAIKNLENYVYALKKNL